MNMKRYLMLFILFLGSLLLVCYQDNSNVVEAYKEETVMVFSDIEDSSILYNNDTSDIRIEIFIIVCLYSLLVSLYLIGDIRYLM